MEGTQERASYVTRFTPLHLVLYPPLRGISIVNPIKLKGVGIIPSFIIISVIYPRHRHLLSLQSFIHITVIYHHLDPLSLSQSFVTIAVSYHRHCHLTPSLIIYHYQSFITIKVIYHYHSHLSLLQSFFTVTVIYQYCNYHCQSGHQHHLFINHYHHSRISFSQSFINIVVAYYQHQSFITITVVNQHQHLLCLSPLPLIITINKRLSQITVVITIKVILSPSFPSPTSSNVFRAPRGKTW